MIEIEVPESFLSPKIQQLFRLTVDNKAVTNNCNNLDGFSNASPFDSAYPLPVLDSERTLSALGPYLVEVFRVDDTFDAVLETIAPWIWEAERRWSLLPDEDEREFLLKHFGWTREPEAFLRSVELFLSKEVVDHVVAYLILTTAIERSLKDVFLHLSGGSSPPLLLRDLLLTSELATSLSRPIVLLFRAFLGSPLSLNLRNIFWHGFCQPGDVSPAYGFFLLSVVVSVGRRFRQSPEFVPSVRSPLASFSQTEEFCSDFPLFSLNNLDALPRFIPLRWRPTVARLTRDLDGASVFDITFGFVLLLPLVESVSRIRFARANESASRIMTAECEEFYTTFDVMLAPTAKRDHDDSAGDNRLVDDLGVPLMELLFDLLQLPSGPRLRDRLGHGEIKFPWKAKEDMSVETKDVLSRRSLQFLLSLLLALASDGSQPFDLIPASNYFSTYKSRFHPIALLRSRLESALVLSRDGDWNVIAVSINERVEGVAANVEAKRVDGMREDEGGRRRLQGAWAHACRVAASSLDFFEGDIENRDESFHDRMWLEEIASRLLTVCSKENQPTTLFRDLGGRSSTLPEFTTLSRQCADQIQRAFREIFSTWSNFEDLWARRKLRSRQRLTYLRFLAVVPLILRTLSISLVLLVKYYENLKISNENAENDHKFVRRMLTSLENLSSFVNFKKNRWDDCYKLIVDLAPAFLHALDIFDASD